jgi:hypothetical protein
VAKTAPVPTQTAGRQATEPLTRHDHFKADAQRIRTLVEAAQGILNGPEKIKLSCAASDWWWP